MRKNTLAIAVVLLGLLAVNPPVADAQQFFRIPRQIELCHLGIEPGDQGTLLLRPILALLHLLFHQYDYVGTCDVLPS